MNERENRDHVVASVIRVYVVVNAIACTIELWSTWEVWRALMKLLDSIAHR